jgi:hypothetical protein
MGVRFSSLLPKLLVHKRLNSKALKSSLHLSTIASAAEIIANWWIVRVQIAADLATTSMSRRCCASGA